MKSQRLIKAVLYCALVVLAVPSVQAAERPAQRGRGQFGLYGDWNIKVKFGEQEMSSILAFSRDSEGNLTGQAISFWGIGELKDVKFEDGNLSYTQTYRFGNNEMTSKFSGKIEDGKLTGTLTSDRGETAVSGERAPRVSRAVGSWAMTFKAEEREYTSTLVIKADKEGNLTAEMKSERVENVISDVTYERGTLSFKRITKMNERQFESTFEGTIDFQTDTLTGKVTSERGESTAEGKRIGTDAIGTWNLEVSSEQGTRQQRLRIDRDLSALYGSLPIKQVTVDGDKIAFTAVLEFGDQKFEMDFTGKITENELTGEMKTSRGTSKVTGKKEVRTFNFGGRRRPNTGQ